MSKFTYNGKTYDTKNRKKGMSEREYKAQIQGTTVDYKKSSSSSKSKSSDKGYDDIVKAITKNTPAQQKVLPDFETTYTPALEAEDLTQSEALYKPYFEKQISDQLEDLNAWSEADSVSYERSLRRARFTLAAGGGGIGTERDQQEGEITQDDQTARENQVRGVERNVGTAAIQNAGYQSATGTPQEGDIVGKMKSAVQEGQLWYKNQRAQRYYGDAKTYYSQPSPYSLDGSKL